MATLQRKGERTSHRPQLDGLRFVAFLMVFLFHQLRESDGPFYFGSDGVLLFFVLSGFLITRILILSETGSLTRDLGVFYIRRTLRIFPLYYFVLLGLLIVGKLPDAPWHFAYASNVYVFLGGPERGPSHFWSLCVEEQFYLTFPLVFYFVSKQFRIAALIVLMLGSIAFRLVLAWSLPSARISWLMPVAAEFLFAGAIIGALEVSGRWRMYPRLALWFGLALYVALTALSYRQRELLALAFGLIVIGLWQGTGLAEVRFLSWRPLVYLGGISYGLYVYHPFAIAAVSRMESWPMGVQTVGAFGLTVACAALSWHTFEKRMNRLKDRFVPGKAC